MDRSKCVICGKVRFRKYLLSVPNLDSSKSWVCSRPVGYNHNYIQIGNGFYLYSPCALSHLKMQYDSLTNQIANYQFSKILFPLFQEIKNLEPKNVAPELTFLLQL